METGKNLGVRRRYPETGVLNHATTRNRTLAVGKRIEQEIREEIDNPCFVPEPAERMVVGIDGAFVKAGQTRTGQRHQFEILTRYVETSERGGEAFAVVRDLDPYANRRSDGFELTSSGWRSPTLRDRGLQSIANFYDELNSNFLPTPTPGY
jgi:hypothetical protein